MSNYNTGCKGCSKEDNGRVPTMRVISKLDECFSKNDLDGARRLLSYWESEARAIGDRRGLLEILNEQIGFFRRTNEETPALNAVNEALEIINAENIEGTVSAATIMINAATTLKAFGKVLESEPIYDSALKIYINEGVTGFRLAALYNNMASAKAEIKKYKAAENFYIKAMDILKSENAHTPEIAVSLVNLAHLYYDMETSGQAASHTPEETMEKALDILNSPEIPRDGNYAFICSKCAPSFGFFGYFVTENELLKRTEDIYEGN